MRLLRRIADGVVANIPDLADRIVEDIDLEEEDGSEFDELRDKLSVCRGLLSDDENYVEVIDEAERGIEKSEGS